MWYFGNGATCKVPLMIVVWTNRKDKGEWPILVMLIRGKQAISGFSKVYTYLLKALAHKNCIC